MTPPDLSLEERQHVESGVWFSSLSPALRAGILARSALRRLADGTALAARGAAAE